jgi:hypothetical protein
MARFCAEGYRQKLEGIAEDDRTEQEGWSQGSSS